MKRGFFGLWAVFLVIFLATAPLLADQGDGHDPVAGELIILLGHGPDAATPEDVVAAVNLNGALPGGIDVGNPTNARFGITNRAKGALIDQIRANPESPRASLERYIVMTYPTPVSLSEISLALKKNPRVLHVEENGSVGFSSFSFTNPDSYNGLQWALDVLNLPAAWAYTKGYAYVGVVDTGIQTAHEDLAPAYSGGQYVGGNRN